MPRIWKPTIIVTRRSPPRRRWQHFGTALQPIVLSAVVFGSSIAYGQNSSLFYQDLPNDGPASLRVSNCSWVYQKSEPPPHLKLHDIITIVVQEKSALDSEGQVDRRKTGVFNAQLKNWVTLKGLSLKSDPLTSGSPQANGTLDQEYQANMQLQTKDSLSFTIAATVVDIRPNGNLVIEAHRRSKDNGDTYDRSVTGLIRPQDVLPNNTVLSQNIAELMIDKHEAGHVRDGYERGWLTRLYDRFSIF
jgi:flagellar L-ring protein precursor FlgH